MQEQYKIQRFCQIKACPKIEASKVIPVKEHCARLVRIIARDISELAIHGYPKPNQYLWSTVWEPIQLAASIENIKVNTGALDDSGAYTMCSSAAEYDDIQSILAKEFVHNLTLFTWCWNAFENMARIVAKKEKVKSATLVISNALEQHLPFHSFNEIAELTDIAIKKIESFGYEKIAKKVSGPQYKKYRYLHLCREMRNTIAHGKIYPPTPDEWYPSKEEVCPKNEYDPRVTVYEDLTRILLLSMQVIFSALIIEKSVKTARVMASEGVIPNVPVHVALRYLHVKWNAPNYNQEELFHQYTPEWEGYL